MRGRRRKQQSGHVLIVALFVIILLMTAAAMIANSLTDRMASFRQEATSIRLTALLDAALAKALASLWANPYYGGMPVEPFGEGTMAIEVRAAETGTVEVTVKATYWGVRRAAQALVRVDSQYPPRFPPRVLRWEPAPFDD